MIISHLHRFIFLKTRKTAGTSVEMALSALCGPCDVITPMSAKEEAVRLGLHAQNYVIPKQYQPKLRRLLHSFGASQRAAGIIYYSHMPAALLKQRVPPPIWQDYCKVTIERNPWDRELSHYFWRSPGLPSPADFEKFVMRPGRHINNFDIYSVNGEIIADVVIRYESLAEDFAAFVGDLGIEAISELPRAKGLFRPASSHNYRGYYNSRTRDAVAERYAREIKAFGYTF
ncbi:MAG TPA: sulfotransferase family 2 domain-containing protein [Propylenella sp.]